jgi:acyl-CoA thioesterase FadM
MAYRHTLRVRYGEVDMQGHAFNAHYLAYVDDACNAWFRQVLGAGYLTPRSTSWSSGPS